MSSCRLRELDFADINSRKCPFKLLRQKDKIRSKGELCLIGCPFPHESPDYSSYRNATRWEFLKWHCCRVYKCVEMENQEKMEKEKSEEKKTETLENHSLETETLENHSLGKNPNDTSLISEAHGDN